MSTAPIREHCSRFHDRSGPNGGLASTYMGWAGLSADFICNQPSAGSAVRFGWVCIPPGGTYLRMILSLSGLFRTYVRPRDVDLAPHPPRLLSPHISAPGGVICVTVVCVCAGQKGGGLGRWKVFSSAAAFFEFLMPIYIVSPFGSSGAHVEVVVGGPPGGSPFWLLKLVRGRRGAALIIVGACHFEVTGPIGYGVKFWPPRGPLFASSRLDS